MNKFKIGDRVKVQFNNRTYKRGRIIDVCSYDLSALVRFNQPPLQGTKEKEFWIINKHITLINIQELRELSLKRILELK